jgi:AraC family transcriptional regulator
MRRVQAPRRRPSNRPWVVRGGVAASITTSRSEVLNESNHQGSELLPRGRFFGTELAHHTAGEVILAEGRYAGHSRIPDHAHRTPYLCLVMDGWFEESCGTRRESCGAGMLLFHPAHEVHANRFGAEGARCFNLELAPKLADRLVEESALPRTRVCLGPGRAGMMAAAIRAAAGSPALEIEEAVLALLDEIGPEVIPPRFRGRPPAWLGWSIERLRSPAAPSIAALAREAGVHPVYFARAFRAVVHTTPGAIARRARLERASAALLASDAPITAVAFEAGYADHSHFCRHFRREFGVTPSHYRRLFVHRTAARRP